MSNEQWARVLKAGEPFPADWKRCACRTRQGGPCPIEADRTWNGMPVCHVHDPNGKMCAGNASARAFAVGQLEALTR